MIKGLDQIRAFGYARLSEEDKNKPKKELETSIINQKEFIKKHCDDNNKKLVKIFVDLYISGSDRSRKEFNDMISRTKNNEADEIISKDKSRFCRDSSFFKDTLVDLRSVNKSVFSIMDNRYLDPDDLGDIVGSVIDERSVIDGKKKQRLLALQKKDKGLPITNPPFGYKYNNSKNNKNWIIDSQNASIVKQVFEMTINGVNYKEICNKLKIKPCLYYKIIKNKSYLGYVIYYNKIKDSTGKIMQKELVEYKGSYIPLIDEETFLKVQKIKS